MMDDIFTEALKNSRFMHRTKITLCNECLCKFKERPGVEVELVDAKDCLFSTPLAFDHNYLESILEVR